MWRRGEVRFVFDVRLSEGSVATMRIVTQVGVLLVMGEPEQDLTGGSLLVRSVHTNGASRPDLTANTVGAANLKAIGQAFLEAFDYDELILEGRGSNVRPAKG